MVRQFGNVAEQIGRRAADRRQKDMQIGPCHQFGKHAGGLLEQLPAQVFLRCCEALRQSGQIPDRVDRNLDHGDAAVLVHDVAILLEPSGLDRGLQFGQIEAGARDGNARTDVDTLGDLAREIFRSEMSPWIERDDPLRLCPLRKRPDGFSRMGIGEVRTPDRVEGAG